MRAASFLDVCCSAILSSGRRALGRRGGGGGAAHGMQQGGSVRYTAGRHTLHCSSYRSPTKFLGESGLLERSNCTERAWLYPEFLFRTHCTPNATHSRQICQQILNMKKEPHVIAIRKHNNDWHSVPTLYTVTRPSIQHYQAIVFGGYGSLYQRLLRKVVGKPSPCVFCFSQPISSLKRLFF